MIRPPRAPGQPLLALAGLLLSWIGLRLAGFGDLPAAQSGRVGRPAPAAAEAPASLGPLVRLSTRQTAISSGRALPSVVVRAPRFVRSAHRLIATRGPADDRTRQAEALETPAVGPGPSPGGAARSLSLAWPSSAHAAVRPAKRWSGDAWLLLREGAGPAPGGAFYGASQVGAVVRFRLNAGDRRGPVAYLRAAAALAAVSEQEMALGLGLRPVSAVPVKLAIELRATRSRTGTHLRPAVVGVSELPPQPLPWGFVAEIYAQGGWIGGPEAQGFGDLQARAERALGTAGSWHVHGGAGLWLAGQRGATRLDLGPVVSATGRLGEGPFIRLELEWRQRTGGRAAPGSGPALVLASSF